VYLFNSKGEFLNKTWGGRSPKARDPQLPHTSLQLPIVRGWHPTSWDHVSYQQCGWTAHNAAMASPLQPRKTNKIKQTQTKSNNVKQYQTISTNPNKINKITTTTTTTAN
jgi:hypothetical protein